MKKILFIFLMLSFCYVTNVAATKSHDLTIRESILLNNAYKLTQKNEYTKATELIKEYIKKNKNVSTYVLKYLANLYILKNNIKNAIIVLKPLVEKGIEDQEIYISLASCYYQQKEYIKGARLFLKAYQLSKQSDTESLYNAGICFYLAKNKTKAYELVKNAIEKNKRIDWVKTYVSILVELEKYKEALPYAVYLSESNIDDKKTYQELRIQIYMSLKDFKTAEKYLMSILDSDLTEFKWWNYLFNIDLARQKYKDALAVLFLKSYLTDLTDDEKKIMGDLFVQLDIPIKAVDFYKKIQSKDDYKGIYLVLARCYMGLGDLDNALFWINKACDKNKNYETYLLKGQILCELKRFKEAVDAFIYASKLTKKPGYSYLMAGYAAYFLKDFHLAKKYFLKATEDNRYKKEAKELIRQISLLAKK